MPAEDTSDTILTTSVWHSVSSFYKLQIKEGCPFIGFPFHFNKRLCIVLVTKKTPETEKVTSYVGVKWKIDPNCLLKFNWQNLKMRLLSPSLKTSSTFDSFTSCSSERVYSLKQKDFMSRICQCLVKWNQRTYFLFLSVSTAQTYVSVFPRGQPTVLTSLYFPIICGICMRGPTDVQLIWSDNISSSLCRHLVVVGVSSKCDICGTAGKISNRDETLFFFLVSRRRRFIFTSLRAPADWKQLLFYCKTILHK